MNIKFRTNMHHTVQIVDKLSVFLKDYQYFSGHNIKTPNTDFCEHDSVTVVVIRYCQYSMQQCFKSHPTDWDHNVNLNIDSSICSK